MVVFYSYMAYSAQEHYTQLMCAIAWIESCVSVNNAIMFGMGILLVALVIITIGVILLIKSFSRQIIRYRS